jgi:hypothetical protein
MKVASDQVYSFSVYVIKTEKLACLLLIRLLRLEIAVITKDFLSREL